jgi:hypothetical protein
LTVLLCARSMICNVQTLETLKTDPSVSKANIRSVSREFSVCGHRICFRPHKSPLLVSKLGLDESNSTIIIIILLLLFPDVACCLKWVNRLGIRVTCQETKAGVHQSRVPGRPGDQNLVWWCLVLSHIYSSVCPCVKPWRRAESATYPWGSQVAAELWFLSITLATCHPSGAYSLEVTPGFLENKWTPA